MIRLTVILVGVVLASIVLVMLLYLFVGWVVMPILDRLSPRD